MEILFDYGLWGLFASAFLAATILPLSSELVLIFLVTQGCDMRMCLLVATAGNILGAVVNYWIGFAGSRWILKRIWRVSDETIHNAVKRFKRFGVLSLLLAWTPVIGDPLTIAAGMLRIHIGVFLLLVGTGKFLRYLFLALAASGS